MTATAIHPRAAAQASDAPLASAAAATASEGTAQTATIVLSDVHAGYRGRTVLDGISLTAYPGRVLCLLGPNGVGKTTTMRLLQGVAPTRSGTVRVLGLDPRADGRTLRLVVGVVPQAARDHDEWTTREVVAFFGSLYPDALPAAEALAAVGLADALDQRLSRLSGGQRRRVDLALALIGRPQVLLMDEPTAGIDPQGRRELILAVRDVARRGVTVLLTTHDMAEAAALADDVVVLAHGRVAAHGAPETLGANLPRPTTEGGHEAGRPVREELLDPGPLLRRLHARYGPEVPELTITRPTLEDRYLALVGVES
jgi:ABC-2 type transport system ATP-binding protein